MDAGLGSPYPALVMRTAPLLVLALLPVACRAAAPGSDAGDGFAIEPARAGERTSRSVEGRTIEVWSLGEGPETVLVIAAIHGNERAGLPLVKRLREVLASEPGRIEGRRVVIVPIANPDGFAADQRHNANGVDLNRNFPATNRREGPAFGESALSEPESMCLASLIEGERPVRIVTIHQPLGCIDWDGPAEEIVERIRALDTLPVHRLGARDGSLGSWAGEDLGVPVITLELPGGMDGKGTDYLWERFGPLLLIALE